MTKEQLELIKELINMMVKEHANDQIIHRKGHPVKGKMCSKKVDQIHQKLLATCENEDGK